MVGGRSHDARFQTEVERPDGSVAAVEIAARALRSGRGMQLVVLGRDVTERREQERERERLLAAERTARREIEAAHARAALLAEVSAITERSRRLRSSLGEVAELVVRDVADVVAIDVIPRRGDQLERFAGGALDNATRRALQRTLGQAESFDDRSATVEAARSGVAALGARRRSSRSDGGARAARDSRLRARRRRAGAADRTRRRRRPAEPRLAARARRPRRRRTRAVDDLSPADRVVDRQRAALRGARAGREHAADGAAPAAAARMCRASSSRPATCRPTRRARSAVTSSTSSGPAPAGRSWSATSAARARRRPRRRRSPATRCAPRSWPGRRARRRASSCSSARCRPMRERTAAGASSPRCSVCCRRAPTAAFDLCLACAGHPPPILLRSDGERETIDPEGGVIGVGLEGGWEERRVVLGADDALLLYTDGVSEAVAQRAARCRRSSPRCFRRSPRATPRRSRARSSTSRARAARAGCATTWRSSRREPFAAPRSRVGRRHTARVAPQCFISPVTGA